MDFSPSGRFLSTTFFGKYGIYKPMIKDLFRKYRYPLSILVVLLIAFLTRFYNFHQHYGLGGDDARDVMIAREALQRHEVPLIGSFSSAGPFVFGPLFYWTIMASILVLPFPFISPWIVIGSMSIVTILILMRASYLIAGERFALLTGILAATSPQMISRALSLGQHSYISFIASLLILNYILLWQRKKIKYGIFIGLCLGIGLSMHYQAINLLIFIPATLLVPGIELRRKIRMIVGLTVALLIPSLPIIFWDAQQSFANTRNILDYLLIGQYRLYVPNSWKLFLSQYFPTYWSFVLGAFKPIGILLMISTGLFILRQVIKKQLPSVLTMISVVFLCMVIVNRYYHGERSEGYLLYLQPFIILLTSYCIYLLIAKTRYPDWYDILVRTGGIMLLFLALIGNLVYLQKHIQYKSTVGAIEKSVAELKHKYPNTKFSVYDYGWQSGNWSQSLSFILERENLIDKKGMPIGFNCIKGCTETYPVITDIAGAPVVDLREAQDLNSKTWMNVNQSSLYDDLMSWTKTEKLKSNFQFFK